MNNVMQIMALSWRQARRDLKSGDVRILLAALMLAVVAVTSVGFVTDRASRALAMEANRLLGGDAVLRSDTPMADAQRDIAKRVAGLRVAETAELNSMLRVGEAVQLGDVRALGAGYPLRGAFRVRDARGTHDAGDVPASGTVWMSQAGAERMQAKVGDVIGIGTRNFRLVAIVIDEPDAALDYFAIAPKAFMRLDELASTGLLQPGSRVGYRQIVAGPAAHVERYLQSVRPTLQRGQRLETVRDARPEIRSALDRAGRFLGLAATLSVVLAAIAAAMAARRHSERHLQGAAVMRCLGASQRVIAGIHISELLWLGLLACVSGVIVAFALQWGVGAWLAQRLRIDIPPASWLPAWQGIATGMIVLLAFGAPPVLALRRVPALRVLRRDLDNTEASAWLVAIAGLVGLAVLLWWKAGSAALGGALLLGISATFAVLALLAWALIVVLRRIRGRLRGSLRYGLANVSRRAGTSVAQVAALGLGMMALLLLGFVRTDLLDRWQLSLKADAPNRFIINAQPDQLRGIGKFVHAQGMAPPTLFPMVRARWVARNGKPVSSADVATQDERARRLAEREFNLSTAQSLRPQDNRVVAGTFWNANTTSPELSVEEEFAKRLGWQLGDTITFDIAGQPLQGRITSLRKVDWESFKPNFFVLVSPGALQGHAASYITAVHVPPTRPRFTAELIARYPNLSVIDVDAVLTQVRNTADQVSLVVRVVFWFSFAAGVLVLLAAISASQDERLREAAVMRVLGGSRRQLRAAQASEFAAIGLLAGLVATIAASVLSGVVAREVFNLPWQPNWAMAAFGGGLGALAALVAGLLATRRALDAPPNITLRELDAA